MSNSKDQHHQEESKQEKPRVFAVSNGENGFKFTRRDFLELAAVAAAATGLAGCDKKISIVPKETDTPEATDTPENTNTPEATDTPEFTQTPSHTPTATASDTPKPTETPSPTNTPVPQAIVQPSSVYLRSGPGTVYNIVDHLYEGDSLQVIGRTSDNRWFETRMDNGTVVWIAASVVEINFDLESVPIQRDIPPTPSPVPPTAPPPTATKKPSGGGGGGGVTCTCDEIHYWYPN